MSADDGGRGRHAGDDESDVHFDNGHQPQRDDVPGAVVEVEFVDAEPEGDYRDDAGAVGYFDVKSGSCIRDVCFFFRGGVDFGGSWEERGVVILTGDPS